MKLRPFHTCLVCLCFIISFSIALDASNKEPSCEELRAMWRFSKRQSRAAEMTNEIPTYKDPFALNVWDDHARPRSAGRGRYKKPPVYGTLVSGTPHTRTVTVENYPERIRAFEEVMRLFDTSIPWPPVTENVGRRKNSFRYSGRGGGFHSTQSGSFQHLKELIRNERARELQEQRMSEEAEQAKLHFPRSQPESTYTREKPAAKGVVAFPDILLPPSYKYLEDYKDYMAPTPQVQKYRHKFPETNSV